MGACLQESSQLAGEKDAGGGGGVSPSPGFNSAQDSKAAKVATLSQALGYVDQYRYATPVPTCFSNEVPDYRYPTVAPNIIHVWDDTSEYGSSFDLAKKLHY